MGTRMWGLRGESLGGGLEFSEREDMCKRESGSHGEREGQGERGVSASIRWVPGVILRAVRYPPHVSQVHT